MDVYMVYEGMKVGPGLELYRDCDVLGPVDLPPPPSALPSIPRPLQPEEEMVEPFCRAEYGKNGKWGSGWWA